MAPGSVSWRGPALLSFSPPNHASAEGFLSPLDLEEEAVEVERAVGMLLWLAVLSGLVPAEQTS